MSVILYVLAFYIYYVFVDIFDKINFDLNNSKGRGIVTTLNGRDARFTEEIHTGDKIEVYWKEM